MSAPTPTLLSRKAPWPRIFTALALLAVLVFFGYIRYRLRDMPLERDEGEYAYAGQLILEGIPPYLLAYNMKLPGTYLAYAAIMAVLGQTPAGIHLGVIFCNAVTVLLIFFVGRKLGGRTAGLIAAACYALLTTSQAVLGFEGHATHFVTLFAVAGELVLLRALEKQTALDYFLSGLLFGTAYVMKQPGIFFVLFGGFYILLRLRRSVSRVSLRAPLLMYALGAVTPFLLVCLWMLEAGVFGRFWFWTVTYASQYASTLGLRQGIESLRTMFFAVVQPTRLIWLLAAVGLFRRMWQPRKAGSDSWFAEALLLFSFLAVCPGLYFRPHYWIVMLPAVALLTGLMIAGVMDASRPNRALQVLTIAALLAGASYAIHKQSDYFFRLDPLSAARETYPNAPFIEAHAVAEYIDKNSPKDATVAVIGSEPEIYFYSHRHSATGYIYVYPLTEPHPYAFEMQREMGSQIERARPEYLAFVAIPDVWLIRPKWAPVIFGWSPDYLASNYDEAGFVELKDPPLYCLGDCVKGSVPKTPWTITLYRRKSAN